MSSEGAGQGKGSAGLGIPVIQCPAAFLIQGFKAGAFLEAGQRLRATDLELYGNRFVQRRGS